MNWLTKGKRRLPTKVEKLVKYLSRFKCGKKSAEEKEQSVIEDNIENQIDKTQAEIFKIVMEGPGKSYREGDGLEVDRVESPLSLSNPIFEFPENPENHTEAEPDQIGFQSKKAARSESEGNHIHTEIGNNQNVDAGMRSEQAQEKVKKAAQAKRAFEEYLKYLALEKLDQNLKEEEDEPTNEMLKLSKWINIFCGCVSVGINIIAALWVILAFMGL